MKSLTDARMRTVKVGWNAAGLPESLASTGRIEVVDATAARGRVLATPATRKLALDLGVDLRTVRLPAGVRLGILLLPGLALLVEALEPLLGVRFGSIGRRSIEGLETRVRDGCEDVPMQTESMRAAVLLYEGCTITEVAEIATRLVAWDCFLRVVISDPVLWVAA